MSAKHPIIAITGSSGAGTTSVMRTFEQIFRREHVDAVFVEGDSFHRYDRTEMKAQMAEQEASAHGQPAGTFTPWEDLRGETDVLFYEGLHGAVVTDKVDAAQHVDLLIGVVPVINLEWIQKLHRDKATRGHTAEAVTETILRRMPDFVNYICPQFSRTHVNFQRVPIVDTSNPFIARTIPAADESMLVIRFADPRGIDFSYLVSMLHDSFMSRANTIVCPGGKMDLAMQLIFTPMIWRLIERRKQATGG
jgi:phosphoribulokinase